MTYKEVIESLSNNLSTYFAEVYHSAEIVINDKGIKQPMVALGDEWISLVPTDQRETVYIRRNGDDEIYAELKLGSCEKAYQMRSSLRVVFFKDHAKNHNEILAHLMQAVLVGGTKLKSIIQNKWKLLKDESSGDYNFGATTAYFAIDIYALWNLIPDNCEEDFCVDVINPLTCGPVATSSTPGVPVPPDSGCCITTEVNGVVNPVQNPLNLVSTDTVTVSYLGNGQVGFQCNCGNSGVIPQFQTNSLINDFQEVLNLVDSDTATFEYLLNGAVTVHCNCGESATLNLSLAPIGSVPNANAATLIGDVLNLEPADVNFGGIVTASDTEQSFRGQKNIVSYTEFIFRGLEGPSKVRTSLYSNGSQAWNLKDDANVEAGSIIYTTPHGYPGIAFWDTSIPSQGRSQIRQYRHTGGISIGSLTPHGEPNNQLVVLPNCHTFITGGIGDISGGGETVVVDRGYMFDVSGSAIIDGQVNLGTASDHADNAAALLAGLAVGDLYRTGDFLKVVH